MLWVLALPNTLFDRPVHIYFVCLYLCLYFHLHIDACSLSLSHNKCMRAYSPALSCLLDCWLMLARFLASLRPFVHASFLSFLRSFLPSLPSLPDSLPYLIADLLAFICTYVQTHVFI